MKKSLLILFVSFFSFQSVNAQQNRESKLYEISYNAIVSIGYGNTVSESVDDYYNSMVRAYRNSGIPLETQTEFGPTLFTNTSIIVNVLERIGAGISFGYLYSPAFTNYKDYAGTVKLNGSINCYEFLFKLRYTPGKIGDFPIILSPQIGASHVSLEMTQEIRFNDYQQKNYDWKMTKSGWGPIFQVTIGTSYDLGEYFISVEGGYRHARVQAMKQAEESTTGYEIVNKEMDMGLDGIISQLSFGIKF